MTLIAPLTRVRKPELGERDLGCSYVGRALAWYASYLGFHSQHYINMCCGISLSLWDVEGGDGKTLNVIFRHTDSVQQSLARDLFLYYNCC